MPSLLPLQLFKNLSDETRLSLVLLLREKGELCVCELVSILKETQPKISRHLALLRESGSITGYRHTCLRGQQRSLSRHICVSGMKFFISVSRLSVITQPPTAKLSACKNFI